MNSSLSFIFITILLDSIGIGLVFPIMPALLREFIATPEEATRAYGLFISLYALMQFLASPILGALSDKFGRRSVLLVSLVGAGIDYLILAFAPTLAILFIGRIIAGLTGASMTVASSYISDTSDDSNRAKRFGYLNAAFGLGFIIGPALGGYLGEYSPRAPFYAAALMNLANFCFGLFVLKESLPPEKRRAVRISQLNPFRSLSWALSEPSLRAGMLVLFVTFLAGQVPPSMWAIYTGERFGWDTRAIGFSLSCYGLFLAVSQATLTGYISKTLGENRTILWGLILYGICYMGFGLATHGWMIYVVLAFDSLASVSGPVMQSQLSGRVSQELQGEFQGTIVSLLSLTAIVGPVAATQLHAAFNGASPVWDLSLPGVSFIAGALGLFFAAILHQMQRPPLVTASSAS